MRRALLGLFATLFLGCSSGDPPKPDESPEAAKRLEAEIKEAQSKEGAFKRGKREE